MPSTAIRLAAVLSFLFTVISCTSDLARKRTPFGPLLVDYTHNTNRRSVVAVGAIQKFYSPDSNDSLKGYGFSNGYSGEQTLTSKITLVGAAGRLSVPDDLSHDLWNLDLSSAHLSEVRTIPGLHGYAIHGGDGERGYTVVFYFRADECVGRVLSTLFEDIFTDRAGRSTILSTRDFKV